MLGMSFCSLVEPALHIVINCHDLSLQSRLYNYLECYFSRTPTDSLKEPVTLPIFSSASIHARVQSRAISIWIRHIKPRDRLGVLLPSRRWL